MFLHIGGTTEILEKDIIAVLDIKTAVGLRLDCCDTGSVINAAEDLPAKSWIIKADGSKNVSVYKSPISTFTLNKRGAKKDVFRV